MDVKQTTPENVLKLQRKCLLTSLQQILTVIATVLILPSQYSYEFIVNMSYRSFRLYNLRQYQFVYATTEYKSMQSVVKQWHANTFRKT